MKNENVDHVHTDNTHNTIKGGNFSEFGKSFVESAGKYLSKTNDCENSILFNDRRKLKNINTLKTHKLPPNLNDKKDKEKDLINDLILFLNKLEMEHQTIFVSRKNEKNTNKMNYAVDLINKKPDEKNVPNPNLNTIHPNVLHANMLSEKNKYYQANGKVNTNQGGKSFINNKIRNLENDFSNLESF